LSNPSPFDFTEENIAAVLLRLEQGENLTDIMGDYGTSHGRWLDRVDIDPELAARHAKAKRLNADAIAERAMRLMEQEPDRTIVVDKDGNPVSARVDTGYVAWQKARVDTRIRLLGVWARDRYGEQRSHEISTPAGRPLQVEDKRDPATMALAIAAALRAHKRDAEPEPDIEDLI
jgi:hypothetical protein